MMRICLSLILMVLALLMPADGVAAELDLSRFASLPVLDEGRVKPLETFAHHTLVKLSGQSSLQGRSAIDWLAQTIFNPSSAADTACFKVASPHLRAMLALPERAGKLYALGEILPGLVKASSATEELMAKAEADLTTDERELLELQRNVVIYNQLMQSLSALLPLPRPAPLALGLPAAATYLQASKIEDELAAQVRGFLTPELIDAPEKMTPEQQQQAGFAFMLQKLREGGRQNVLLRILPALWQEQSGEWLSPWQMLLGGQGSPQSQELVEQWQHMASAYGQADAAAWTTAVAAAQALLPPDLNWRLWAELWQGRLHLLDGVTLLLAVAAGLALAGRNRAAFLAHSLACLALLGAIGLRIYILQRPPVGTLYESILFVALIVALGAVLMRQWLVSAALGGFILMLVAALLQGEGDNMGMLTAVLNTNFWLTVHVLCITAGYGACLLTALWAHLLLWRGGAFMAAPERGDMLRHLSLASLLLTAIGTLLGGVWADQSWGRFWGWDPKENGALVIVLWLLWLQHGRMAGLIGQLAFTAGMAALGVVVALAWFGVNLLGTGLHSYGFITGVATGLALYSGANLALIGVLWWRARQGQLYVA